MIQRSQGLVGVWASLVIGFGLFACNERDVPAVHTERALATVGDEVITATDVDVMLATLLKDGAAPEADAAQRARALNVVTDRRTVALARLRELSRSERAELEQGVSEYRERLLVERYIEVHKLFAPANDAMVKRHYDAHLDDYGRRTAKTFELITTDRALTHEERAKVQAVLAAGRDRADWAVMVQELKPGLALVHRDAQDARVLHPRLRREVESLKVGATGEPTFVQGVPFLVRVTGEAVVAARPLSEVAALIREQLRPTQLREAIEEASEPLLKKAKVEFR